MEEGRDGKWAANTRKCDGSREEKSWEWPSLNEDGVG